MQIMTMLPSFLLASLVILAVDGSSLNPHLVSHTSVFQRKSTAYLHLDRRDGVASEGIKFDGGFWYADVTVGSVSNLSLLIDTGSADLILNPGLYVPGNTSHNLNLAFENTYGTTSNDGTGAATVVGKLYSDQVSYGGLTALQTVGSANESSPLPSSGIIGFSGQIFSRFPNNSTSFFQSLCEQGQVSECRFGLALTDNGTGTQVLGELDNALFDGDLVVAPVLAEWVVYGDLVIDGTVTAKDLIIELDSGTATVVGPIDAVASIFSATGIKGVISTTSEGELLTGYYPCDKPPTVGFSFPSQSNISVAGSDNPSLVSSKSSIFNIPSNAWAAVDNGNNNCTAILSGQNYEALPGLWVVGQPFFQGLYIDHNLADGTMGFASLKTDEQSPTSPLPTPVPTSGAALHTLSAWVILVFACVATLAI